ncbi:MAG: hypothetical protein Q9209_005254 [Squamulea sp. 1 TL-2023]
MSNAKPPSPITWAASEWWEGNNGNWSSFDLRVGSPEQVVRVLPSTAGSATWIVTSGGCDPPSLDCSNARGGLFDQTRSSTWEDLGPFTLALEQNLGYNESGAFGLDTISLGLSNATGGPTLTSQIIAGIETERWYLGVFGLQQQPMNLTDFSKPQQSFLSTLRAHNLIPSLSWSYTAGAHYQSKGSFGSLTLGGSDISRYKPTNVSFNLAPDVGRDLVVGIKSITSTYANGSRSSLLRSPTLAFIDSTVPYLYLPEDVCKTFEAELGLVYNQKNNFYFVDDALHQTLSTLKPQFNFSLANDESSESTVDIILPYASFDLVAKPPLVPNATSYFPLRRGADNQITLGRAFLQEAYLITDYDHKNFTIAQAVFNDSAKPNIVPIPWNATTVRHDDQGISRQAIIGISTGSAVFVLLMVVLISILTLRWRTRRGLTPSNNATINDKQVDEVRPFSYIIPQEIGHQSIPELHDIAHHIELLNGQAPSGSGNIMIELPDGKDRSNHELSIPATPHGSGSSLNVENEPPNIRVVQTSGTTNLPSDPASYRNTLEHGRANHRSNERTTRTSHAHLSTDINKALPHVPIAKIHTEGLRPLSRFHPVIQKPPIVQQKTERRPTARQQNSVHPSPQTSPVTTYATIFDVEEYKDSAVVTETQYRSF